MTEIGNSIRTLRNRHNMKQDELAALLHVTRQTVSNYENGKSEPDIDTLLRIAEIFGTDVNTLLHTPTASPSVKTQKSIKAAIPLILCTILAFIITDHLTDASIKWGSMNYDLSFNWVVVGFLYPCCLLLLGWTIIYTIEQLAQFPLQQPWYQVAHYILLAVVIINIGLYLPLTIWAIGGVIEILPSILAGDWTANPNSSPFQTLLSSRHMFFLSSHPKLYYTVITILGALLRLTKRKKTEVT